MKFNFLLTICLSVLLVMPSGSRAAMTQKGLREVAPAPQRHGSISKPVNNSPALASVQSSRWQTQTLMGESLRTFMNSPSIAVNAAGQPQIAMQKDGSIEYRSYNGITWTIERVDTGYAPSLALDAEGHPHIAYYGTDGGISIQHAWHDGTQWRIDIVDRGSLGPELTISLELDAIGHPHIAYISSDLRYARYDGDSWITRTVDSASLSPSLALDNDGRPHMTYLRTSATASTLIYARLDNDVWQQESLDDGLNHPFDLYPSLEHPSLEIDDQGWPHISYSKVTQLKYTWRDQTDWHIETITKDGARAAHLVLDQRNQIHIGYVGSDGWNYAWRDWRGNWHIETVMGVGATSVNDGSLYIAGNDAHTSVIIGYNAQIVYVDRPVYAVRRAQPDLTTSSLSVSASTINPGGKITYTLELVNASPVSSTTFAISNPIPTHTTYVTNSVVANSGQITATEVMTSVTWTGVISPMTVLTASFAVTASAGLTEPTAIVDMATIAGDPIGPIILQAATFHKPYLLFVPQNPNLGLGRSG